ncbi:uncharacterized protein LOC107788660 isoform X2 [Nicotiana tabacum]|uniref:Uncharacterized protein LOC107788660 isoform X2 n=1 Tax=Nicotiana tabacum TaxID=4097 RepID=A0A1S3ZNH1_TOBAC|nr:PREDICTED: uncharacterized protein LOC107788660 isoform X2 [Nicotiana tabacum]
MNEKGSMMNQQVMMSMNQPQIMNPHLQLQQQMMQQPQPSMMTRSHGMWPPTMTIDQMKFQNPNVMKGHGFVAGGTQSKNLGPRNNWKGKKGNKNDKRMVDIGRRKEKAIMATGYISGDGNVGGFGGGYKPPTLNELQYQNRLKAKRFFPKKKFYHNNNNNNNNNNNMGAPFAPRNTTSFIIRAKKSGGIASLVSPCPVTPAVLPTPNFSPSREVLVDMAKEEWGVDGYGSMKGLIRLRSPGHEMELHEEEEEDEEGGSSESDVEEHVEVERRLDHDLSRFEMIYPNSGGLEYNNVLENRVDDQDSHIAQLEEENLILKERLFLMEREFGDLKRRLQSLERQGCGFDEINEEVVENESEESESHGESHSAEEHNVEFLEQNMEGGDRDVKAEEDKANDGDNESAQEEKVEGHEEFNLTLHDEPPKNEIIAHAGIKCERNEDANVRDENKVEVTQRNEDGKNNIESSDNAGVGDETMEEASLPDAEAVVQTNTEDEEPGNE